MAWEPNEQQMALIREVCEKNFQHWLTNCTEEQKAIGREELRRYQEGDQEFIQERTTAMTNAFNAADANGDGRLDLEEARVFYNTLKDADEAAGRHSGGHYPGGIEDNYRMTNAVNPDTEGFTWEEFT